MMGLLLLALRVLLAAVFGTAGVAKLHDLSGSRTALEEFGVPARLGPAAVFLLPACELAVAISLLLKPSAVWGAAGAVLLLGAFTAAIAVALAHGRAPECHCFGQIHSERAGGTTLLRNSVLAGVAASVALGGPGPSLSGWVSTHSAAEVIAAAGVAAVVAAAALRAGRWHRRRAAARATRERERPAGLPLDTPAPDFDLGSKLCGCSASLEALTAPGRPLLLIFTHPDCVPCAELLAHVGRWQESLYEQLTIAIISQGDWERNMAAQAEHGVYNVLVERDTEVYSAYGMRGTPSAVVVSPDRRIASATARGPLEVEELVRQTLRRTRVSQAAVAA